MRALVLIPMLFVLAACAGTSDLGRGKTGKQFIVSGRSYEQVWAASRASLLEQTGDQSLEIEKNLAIQKENKAAGELIASTGMSMLSWGEVVGVYITPPYDAPVHTVEVESRTKMQTNLFANNWEDEIIAGIKQRLAVQ